MTDDFVVEGWRPQGLAHNVGASRETIMTNTGSIVAAVKLRSERQIVRALCAHNATSAAAATAIDVHRPLGQAALRSLVRSGAIKQGAASTYYLDEDAYRQMRRKRGRLMAILIFIAFAIAVAAFVYATVFQN